MENKVVVVETRLDLWETIQAIVKEEQGYEDVTVVYRNVGRSSTDLDTLHSLLMLGFNVVLQRVLVVESHGRLDLVITRRPNNSCEFGTMTLAIKPIVEEQTSIF